MEASHTGEYLAEIMTNEFKKCNVYSKVIAIVTDGGSNNKSAVRTLGI